MNEKYPFGKNIGDLVMLANVMHGMSGLAASLIACPDENIRMEVCVLIFQALEAARDGDRAEALNVSTRLKKAAARIANGR